MQGLETLINKKNVMDIHQQPVWCMLKLFKLSNNVLIIQRLICNSTSDSAISFKYMGTQYLASRF